MGFVKMMGRWAKGSEIHIKCMAMTLTFHIDLKIIGPNTLAFPILSRLYFNGYWLSPMPLRTGHDAS